MKNLNNNRPHLVLVGLLAILGACAGGGGNVVPASYCEAIQPTGANYVLGPGDTLKIVVWRSPELSVDLPIRPDGKISTPMVDDMQASGKTPSELAQDIEVMLAKYIRTPEVSVLVTGQGGANQIQVIGAVNNPHPVRYRDGMHMLDLVIEVGGLTDFAAGNRSKLLRYPGRDITTSRSGQLECRILLKDLLSGDMSNNILVYPGDVLVVPLSRF